MGLWPIIPAETADIVPASDMTQMLAAREAKLKSDHAGPERLAPQIPSNNIFSAEMPPGF